MDEFTQTPLDSATPKAPETLPVTHHISKRVFKYLVILAGTLGVVSVLLYFFGGSSFTESKVILTLEGPTQASAGDEVVYKVHYKNNTKTTLHDIKLSLNYPDGAIIIKDDEVFTTAGNVIVLDQEDLKSGESRDQEFHAFLIGDRGNIKLARVKLTFAAGNIKSPFEKTAQLSTTISDMPIALTLVAPPTTSTGQTITYVFDYRNQTQEDISDLQLIMKYPDGFTVSKVTPTTPGSSTWEIPILKKGEGKRVTIQGTLTGREGDSKQVTALIKRKIFGTFIDYEKISAVTVISSPLLNVDTSINGSQAYISHAGDTLQYQIYYQNTSNYTFSGLTLTAKLEGSMYDYSTVDPKGGFYDSSTHTISWNSTVLPAFNSFPPRAAGTASFSIKLKSTASGVGSNSLFAHAIVTLSTENVPDAVEANVVSAIDDVLTKITSQPTFRETLYYSDMAFGSSGPMPPQAGKETSFTVHWQVVNPGNAVNNAKIVGTLPQGVTWKNAVSVGSGQPQPIFNKNTSQVIWNIGTLPAGVGTGGTAAYELAFQVNVKPSTTQINQPAPIISGVSLSGSDSSTGQNIIVSAPDLTTNSTVDQPGQGVVQP